MFFCITARFPDCTVPGKEYSGAIFRTGTVPVSTCKNWAASNNRE